MNAGRLVKTLVLFTILACITTVAALARLNILSAADARSVHVDSERPQHGTQSVPANLSKATSHSMSLAVNGEQTPELIPDSVAYRHLLAATAFSQRLPVRQQAAVRKRSAKIGLSERDAQYYEAVLITLGVRDELTRIAQERRLLSPAAAKPSQAAMSRLRWLRQQEEDLMDYAKNQVVQGLTPEGVATLNDYVQKNVKVRMKIFRGGHMGASH